MTGPGTQLLARMQKDVCYSGSNLLAWTRPSKYDLYGRNVLDCLSCALVSAWLCTQFLAACKPVLCDSPTCRRRAAGRDRNISQRSQAECGSATDLTAVHTIYLNLFWREVEPSLLHTHTCCLAVCMEKHLSGFLTLHSTQLGIVHPHLICNIIYIM